MTDRATKLRTASPRSLGVFLTLLLGACGTDDGDPETTTPGASTGGAVVWNRRRGVHQQWWNVR